MTPGDKASRNMEVFQSFHKTYPRNKHGISGVSVCTKEILVLFHNDEDLGAFAPIAFDGLPIVKAVGKFKAL